MSFNKYRPYFLKISVLNECDCLKLDSTTPEIYHNPPRWILQPIWPIMSCDLMINVDSMPGNIHCNAPCSALGYRIVLKIEKRVSTFCDTDLALVNGILSDARCYGHNHLYLTVNNTAAYDLEISTVRTSAGPVTFMIVVPFLCACTMG